MGIIAERDETCKRQEHRRRAGVSGNDGAGASRRRADEMVGPTGTGRRGTPGSTRGKGYLGGAGGPMLTLPASTVAAPGQVLPP